MREEVNRRADTVAIIPARGGSKGIPRKNIRLLCGRPLLAYTIKPALDSKYIDRVVVSTEDREIAEIAKAYGADVVPRPMELAQDDTPPIKVCQQVIKHLEEVERLYPEIIVTLQPTSPLRTVEDIDGAIEKFLKSGCGSVVTVCETEHPPEWMYRLEGDRLQPLIEAGKRITRRQNAPRTYRLNGAVDVTKRDVIMEQDSIIRDDTMAYVMPLERSIDIDTELDFELAELLMRKNEECKNQ